MIELATQSGAQAIRKVIRMQTRNVVAAFTLVEANGALRLQRWREYHG